MKSKTKIRSKSNLNLAIEQVETYIKNLQPQSYTDIKIATRTITKAAVGAHLSVHNVTETLEFINQLAHSLVEDITEHMTVPSDYGNTVH